MGKIAVKSNRSNVVLIAEDNSEIRELVCTELEIEGFKVISANNGKEAVSKTRSLQPDVIVMDLVMPVMNGIEAIRKLKEDNGTSHIPIIVGTVSEEKEDIVKSFEAGAIAYINKPYLLSELKAKISSALESKKLDNNLIESEGKYRLLVENANEAILVIRDGILTFFNPAASELVDYPESDLSSKPFVEFVHPQDREEVHDYHTNILLGKRACPAFSFRLVSNDDKIKWVEAKGEQMVDDTLVHLPVS